MGRPPKVLEILMTLKWSYLPPVMVAVVMAMIAAGGGYVAAQVFAAPGETHGPLLTIQTSTNGEDADWSAIGPYINVGTSVEWLYEVANPGGETLLDVAVSDDQGAAVSCPTDVLLPGESMVCDAISTAAAGQFRNLGEVTAVYESGAPLQAADPSHYFGAEPLLAIEKSTNGADADESRGLDIPVGDTVTWVYEVANTGNVTVANVTVTDDRIGLIECAGGSIYDGLPSLDYPSGEYPSSQYVSEPYPSSPYASEPYQSWPYPSSPGDGTYQAEPYPSFPAGAIILRPGETMTCTATGESVAGPYENVGTVTAESPTGEMVDASDLSHYFGSNPGLSLDKMTNGVDGREAPGPYIVAGSGVTWTYVVTNTGNEDVFGIVVIDDDPVLQAVCPQTTLVVGESMTCIASGTAAVGQYMNVATAVGTSADSREVSESDISHYFGIAPGLVLEKLTNGEDADAAPGLLIDIGEEIVWEYLVTNTGDADLTDLIVEDDDLAITVTCPSDVLAAGATVRCTAEGVATAGGYSNIAIAAATMPTGEALTAEDLSHYFGVVSAIGIEKFTNGVDAVEPGESITTGDPVEWTYVVVNSGNVDLTDIEIFDDQDVVVSCPSSMLPAGETMTCTGQGIAIDGGYSNLGRVTGTDPLGRSIIDSDVSYYTGTTRGRRADVSIGNLVWEDANNDGEYQSTEFGIGGVVVHLFADADADGIADDQNNDGVIDASDAIAVTNTDANGLYLFTGLEAGDFVVGLAPVNWVPDGALYGYLSSTFTQGTPNNDVDNDDNGAEGVDGYVWSGRLQVTADEPLGEIPDNDASTPDEQENLTLDFGLWQPDWDLALTKNLDDGTTERTIAVGDEVTYTIVVTNEGDVNAAGIVITDVVPPGLVLADEDWELDDDGNATHALVEVTIAPGESAEVPITFTFDGSATLIENVAEITEAVPVDVLGLVLRLASGLLPTDVDADRMDVAGVQFTPEDLPFADPTPTPTETPTVGVDPTQVADPSPTAIPTATETPTAIPTPVDYPSQEQSPTPVATETPTVEPTVAATVAATVEPTPTSEATDDDDAPTATATPTVAATATPTVTATATATATPTATPASLGAPAENLAFTGGSALRMVLMAIVLIGAGGLLVVATRRKFNNA